MIRRKRRGKRRKKKKKKKKDVDLEMRDVEMYKKNGPSLERYAVIIMSIFY